VGKGEAKPLRQLLDALSDFSSGKRSKLVEERLDWRSAVYHAK
jgi:hypothetical protein